MQHILGSNISSSGIMVNYLSQNDYCFIGIEVSINPIQQHLVIAHVTNGNYDYLNSTILKYMEYTYYLLSITITNGSFYHIKINDIPRLSASQQIEPSSNSILSGYIGIINYNAYMNAKHLYISGLKVSQIFETTTATPSTGPITGLPTENNIFSRKIKVTKIPKLINSTKVFISLP